MMEDLMSVSLVLQSTSDQRDRRVEVVDAPSLDVAVNDREESSDGGWWVVGAYYTGLVEFDAGVITSNTSNERS